MDTEMDYIDIDKGELPYNVDIDIEGLNCSFDFAYNSLADFFTVSLSINDDPVVQGEKIIYGKSLFDVADPFSRTCIIPLDLAEKETVITYENMNETVFLYCIDTGDDDVS